MRVMQPALDRTSHIAEGNQLARGTTSGGDSDTLPTAETALSSNLISSTDCNRVRG